MRYRTYILATLFAVVCTCAAGTSFAQTKEIEAQKDKIKELEEDISYLDKQIKATREKQKNTMDELVLLQRKITNRKNLLAELDAKIKDQTKQINSTSRNIRLLEQQLDTLEHYYRNMVYNAYKHRDTKLWFMYILASNNFNQGYRRWSYLKNYSGTINAQSEKIRALKDEHTLQLKKLQTLKNNNITAQKSRTKEYNTLAEEEKQGKTFVASLNRKQLEYKRSLNKKQEEANRLAKEVERLIAIEIKRQEDIARRQAALAAKAKSDTQAVADTKVDKAAQMEMQEYSSNTRLSGSFAMNKGNLPFPVSSGVVIEQFGEHPHPTLKNVRLPFNNGINISTTPGNSVRVVFDGTVKQVIAIPGYNQCVLVQHGQYFTFYCKLANVDVKVGEKLSTGDTIGKLENNNATAILHFELWNGTTKQNPQLWLKK